MDCQRLTFHPLAPYWSDHLIAYPADFIHLDGRVREDSSRRRVIFSVAFTPTVGLPFFRRFRTQPKWRESSLTSR